MQLTWHILGYSAAAATGFVVALVLAAVVRRSRAPWVHTRLRKHFAPAALSTVTVTERQFPASVRADLQQTLDRFFVDSARVQQVCGIRTDDAAFVGISLASLLSEFTSARNVALEYDEIDIGEEQAVRCLGNTLWLLEAEKSKHAVVLSTVVNFHTGAPKIRLAVASANSQSQPKFAQQFFRALEEAVHKAQSYRGKVLSFESTAAYTGQSTGITVHRIPKVARDDIVLPCKTLELLERNILQFVKQRHALSELGQSARKGVLFYGSPGNGKTHTIHYLIGELKSHTTILISAEQIGELAEYMALARLLQPSLVVLEDVDLIARERSQAGSPCQESLLNKLLNEMDGLKPDAEIIFMLTTNRPEQLEEALTARPGRVDQTIEFPAPDAAGREKLVKLYARAVEIPEPVVRRIVERTDGVSAAFIKELMRRALQFHLARCSSPTIDMDDVENALAELVVHGGPLNRKFLGFGHADASTKANGN